VRALLAASVLCACSGARARAPEPPPAPEAVSGLWELGDGSGILMQIALVDNMPQIDAWSPASATEPETHFTVGAIAWDGRRLQATFTYPPSKTTTRSDLTLANADRLEGTVSGAYSGKETWVRTVKTLRQDAGPTSPADTPRTPP
jgi:hypothetical protein